MFSDIIFSVIPICNFLFLPIILATAPKLLMYEREHVYSSILDRTLPGWGLLRIL